MDGGRTIVEYGQYAGLCTTLGADPRLGLTRDAVYKLFEKAPKETFEAVYRSINPSAELVITEAVQFREPVQGMLATEYRARCDVIFEQHERSINQLHGQVGAGRARWAECYHLGELCQSARVQLRKSAPGRDRVVVITRQHEDSGEPSD